MVQAQFSLDGDNMLVFYWYSKPACFHLEQENIFSFRLLFSPKCFVDRSEILFRCLLTMCLYFIGIPILHDFIRNENTKSIESCLQFFTLVKDSFSYFCLENRFQTTGVILNFHSLMPYH
ncbi:hypothetical protein EUGRSUZ_B01761 [Eucalyptus grandis]|uniref:Uncharacterized protein n=2 Tax=Eucalyptus grandis TaxID=71139 RepID=A0A059D313_EUCGR|nr:hypothetical protein EUGRSUZ_B01761 [Eucalyptus grandis]